MFRFSIRDVLWLTALVAMGAVWYREHLVTEKLTAETARLAAESAANRKVVVEQRKVFSEAATEYRKDYKAQLEEEYQTKLEALLPRLPADGTRYLNQTWERRK